MKILKKSEFFISPSGMERIFKCPRMYKLGLEYEPLKAGYYLARGKRLHALLDGKTLPDVLDSEEILAAKVNKFEDDLGYKIIQREQKQYFPVSPGITGVRVIDALAEHASRLKIIDYKFPARRWKMFGEIQPKARTWQATAYTMRPELTMSWPDILEFFVVTNSYIDIYMYQHDKNKEKEFIDAAKLAKSIHDSKKFPRNEGYACEYCNFFDACNQLPGWQDNYKERKNEHK